MHGQNHIKVVDTVYNDKPIYNLASYIIRFAMSCTSCGQHL